MGGCDIPITRRQDREEFGFAESRAYEKVFAIEQRANGARVLFVANFPKFLAAGRIVGDHGFGCWRDNLLLALDLDGMGSAVGFFPVAILGAVVDFAIGFPNGLAGVFIEGNEVLVVEAIHAEDQEVAEEDGASPSTSVVVARQIPSFPKDRCVLGIERCGAISTKRDVNSLAIADRSRRAVGVELVIVFLRFLIGENHSIDQDFSVVSIDGKHRHAQSIVGGVGQPDFFAPDDRGGPSLTRQIRAPGDVGRFVPEDRWIARRSGVSIPLGAAVLGPESFASLRHLLGVPSPLDIFVGKIDTLR